MAVFSADLVSRQWPENRETPERLPGRQQINPTIVQVILDTRYMGISPAHGNAGIGSHLNGVSLTLQGLEAVPEFSYLVVEMLRKGIAVVDAESTADKNMPRRRRRCIATERRWGTQSVEDEMPTVDVPWHAQKEE